MKVFIVQHEESGRVVYCPTKQQALNTLAVCLRHQETRSLRDRESVTVSLGKISKKEFDAMEDMPDDEC